MSRSRSDSLSRLWSRSARYSGSKGFSKYCREPSNIRSMMVPIRPNPSSGVNALGPVGVGSITRSIGRSSSSAREYRVSSAPRCGWVDSTQVPPRSTR
ncbi:hypothetical protein SMICM17S_00302 [Streptomyces microflavus]